ncbi:heparinase II/III family protein [Salinigranum halophilum]|uniref:heparinase II/III family protein n=1 Tax=Salinigranum halophilum TaxID=2565931 RepID=UPI00115F71C1|nr:alginate lyase family protein [Salinigranum halophilum]
MNQPESIEKLRLGLWTVSRLQREQLLGIVDRKLRHTFVPKIPVDFDARYERQIPTELDPTLGPTFQNLTTLQKCLSSATVERHVQKINSFSDFQLEFLNITIELREHRTIEWGNEQLNEVPLLWWLKYSSFEQLDWFFSAERRLENPIEFVKEVLDPWIREMVSRTVIGSEEYLRRDWIPHAVSLRIMRLCRYCAWLDANDMLSSREFILRYLYKNTLFLRNHIETDVGGNHLIENALALTMSGLVFQSKTDWLETGLSLFENAGQNQFLDDGGHFERSPMYHIMVLTRFLSAVGLLDSYGRHVPDALLQVSRSATQFIRTLTPPDGRIPLLNDAVFNEFFSISEVLNYADSVGISFGSPSSTLSDTGYYWLGEGESRLLFDGGGVGPPHLPGHSHIDLLSIMLWLHGQRVLTDTGVYQYLPDENRRYARSVQAHNSVQVGTSGPIDVGGQYLMGRRTNPTVGHHESDLINTLVGEYDVSRSFEESYTHRRRVDSNGDWWLITDSIVGVDSKPVISRLHAHPDVKINQSTNNQFIIEGQDGEILGTLDTNGCLRATLDTSSYFPEFGTTCPRQTVELTYGESTGWFFFSTGTGGSVTYDRNSGSLEIDSTHYSLPSL